MHGVITDDIQVLMSKFQGKFQSNFWGIFCIYFDYEDNRTYKSKGVELLAPVIAICF